MRDALVALYARTFGRSPETITRLVPDGSQRQYFRLTGAGRAPVVGAHGPDAEENRAFLSFSRALRSADLPVPEIHAADEHLGIWLEEDLGDTTLFAALTAARAGAPPDAAFPPGMLAAYERVVEQLVRFQVDGARVVDFSLAYPRAAFDAQSMLWDLNYFKYHFLKLAHVPFNEQRLENDFERLVAHLLAADRGYFLYRDFQSRNVMLRDGEPWFLDYQGGRRGAAQYDLASLLYDAKADLPEPVRAGLRERYLAAFADLGGDRTSFVEFFPGYVLVRIMQAMGAYGYRGFYERKPRFLESVPYAARNVARLLDAGLPVALPELEAVFRRIIETWGERVVTPPPAGLHVHVCSFSYRDGLPGDETGHGGGFVFDCRSLSNPGRRPELSVRIGTEPEIVRFLEAMPETEAFWKHAVALVDAHIANFRERGFSDFSVAFGCTGGQHRSVYFAERMARHIGERFPDVTPHLRHLAEHRWKRAVEPAAAR